MLPIKNSIFTKDAINGALTEFPYENENEIFDAEEIINALIKS